MKKVYLSILGIAVLGGSFAQRNYESKQSSPKKIHLNNGTIENTAQSKSIEKAIGTEIWSDNFSTPANWTINNDGQSAIGFGWDIGTTVDSWFFSSPVNSISDGNFAELGNGDPSATPETQALNVTYTLTTSAPIDIATLTTGSNDTDVTLSFMQYGAHFYDAQEVYISIDGTSWILAGSNNDVAPYTASGGSAYTNPTTKNINLGPILSGLNTSTVWVRFSWTTGEPSQASDPNVWVCYGWMIDDVKISTNSDNNLTLIQPTTSVGVEELTYTQIPLNQISPIKFTANIINNGITTQTNTQLDVLVVGGSTFSSIDTLLSAGDTMLAVTAPYTPASTIATKTFTYSVGSSDFTEDVPTDNSGTGTLKITNSIYAVDNGVKSGSVNQLGGTSVGLPLKIGNLMEIMVDDVIDSMYITLGSDAENVGQDFTGEVWRYDGSDFTKVATTDYTTVTTASNNTTVKLPLMQIMPVSAGDVLLVLACNGGGPTPISFGTAQKVEEGTVNGIDNTDESVYYLSDPEAIMVRLVLNKNAGINENTSSISIGNLFPNPTTGQTSISYSLENASAVSINIKDITGKTVYTSNEGTQTSGAHKISLDASTYTNGVYFVTVSTDESQVTKKLIKK